MPFDANRTDILNKALVRAGCLPVNQGVTQHPSGVALDMLFDLVLKNMLSYPWHFAKRVTSLVRDAAAPQVHWKYAYGLPSDRIGPPNAVYDSGDCKQAFFAYEIVGEKIWTDAAAIWVRDSFVPAPGLWPGYFDDCFTLGLAIEFCRAIREDEAKAQSLYAELYGSPNYHGQGGRFQVAKSTDAMAEPGRPIAEGYDPLTTLWRAGG